MRIDIGDNSFPMSGKLDVKEGDFEIYISRRQVPDENNYDLKFTQDFVVNYNQSTEFEHVYFTILAMNNVKMTLVVSFSAAKDRTSSNFNAQSQMAQSHRELKRNAYVDPFPDFDPKTQKWPNEVGIYIVICAELILNIQLML